ncbi:MAG TPA: hypothetical protein DHV00_08205 [Alteromonas macleodii]|nr:hypothetical protein [Alteromonas macleodii]|tara:strand:+ start:176 stop:382 length:207 start_codon:yes stop_codon:yes gene_type:complete
MRFRSKVTTAARIAALEQRKLEKKRKPIALYPELLLVDGWEQLAVPRQVYLKENVKTHEPVSYEHLES